MLSRAGTGAGLAPQFASPPDLPGVDEVATEETAILPPSARPLRITPLVGEGDTVARGEAVACLRHAADVCLVSPCAGRVARIDLRPGRRLAEIVVFAEAPGDVERHDLSGADGNGGLRALMQGAGVWPLLQRRPFGGMPAPGETPAAIVVMAIDTRPDAPDPLHALEGREEEFGRGLSALARLTAGQVFLCQPRGARIAGVARHDRVRIVPCGKRHPQGSPGIRVHRSCPAGLDAPVWDMHAEDVAALGALLATGELPMMRLVHVSGAALSNSRTLRTHPGADLRQLTQRLVAPGPHVLMTGSALDGKSARWLGARDRQVAVLPRTGERRAAHWLVAALTASAGGSAAIPTAALTQSLGSAVPAAPFIRAIGAGDDETAMKLGLLSMLEVDLALADYVLGEAGHLLAEMRAMLDRIEAEAAP